MTISDTRPARNHSISVGMRYVDLLLTVFADVPDPLAHAAAVLVDEREHLLDERRRSGDDDKPMSRRIMRCERALDALKSGAA
jgi:hypothetical protein